MSDEPIIIVEGKDQIPENIFDGVIRTIKYKSGMEMTIGCPPCLDLFRESDEEFEARMEREAADMPTLEEMVKQGIITAEEAAQDPLESWLS